MNVAAHGGRSHELLGSRTAYYESGDCHSFCVDQWTITPLRSSGTKRSSDVPHQMRYNGRYHGAFGMRRVVFANPLDLAMLGLATWQWVDISI